MAVSDEFIDYVIDQLAAWGKVSARRMFGGAGLYCDGTMFGLIADDVAYLPSALRLRLEEKADDSPSAVSRSGRSNRNREDFVKARPTEASGGRTGSSPLNPYPDKAKPDEAASVAKVGHPKVRTHGFRPTP